jgi:hypothetical protein
MDNEFILKFDRREGEAASFYDVDGEEEEPQPQEA